MNLHLIPFIEEKKNVKHVTPVTGCPLFSLILVLYNKQFCINQVTLIIFKNVKCRPWIFYVW